MASEDADIAHADMTACAAAEIVAEPARVLEFEYRVAKLHPQTAAAVASFFCVFEPAEASPHLDGIAEGRTPRSTEPRTWDVALLQRLYRTARRTALPGRKQGAAALMEHSCRPAPVHAADVVDRSSPAPAPEDVKERESTQWLVVGEGLALSWQRHQVLLEERPPWGAKTSWRPPRRSGRPRRREVMPELETASVRCAEAWRRSKDLRQDTRTRTKR